MSHYFSNETDTIENRREISFRFLGHTYSLVSSEGVFSKDAFDKGTEILLSEVSKLDIEGDVGDLGSGIGVIGVVLNQIFDVNMLGVDVNPKAVKLANENYAQHHVRGKNIVSDGIEGNFDYIISNPPMRVGKEILYRLFDEAHAALKVEGAFVFVIRKSHGALSAQKKCMSLFGNCELLNRSKGYHVYRAVKLDNLPNME